MSQACVRRVTVGTLVFVLLSSCAHSSHSRESAESVSPEEREFHITLIQGRLEALESEVSTLRETLTKTLPASLELHEDAKKRIDFLYQTIGGVRNPEQ